MSDRKSTKKEKIINFKDTEENKDMLNEIAEKMGWSIAVLLRTKYRSGLEAYKKSKNPQDFLDK